MAIKRNRRKRTQNDRRDIYIAQKVALKDRQFNTIVNNPEREEERKALEKKRQAEAYRKASDGECHG
jgi:hypothetical protein